MAVYYKFEFKFRLLISDPDKTTSFNHFNDVSHTYLILVPKEYS